MPCDVLRCVVVRVWRRVLQRGEVCCGVVMRCSALRCGVVERDVMKCGALVLARGACVHLNFVALGILQHCALFIVKFEDMNVRGLHVRIYRLNEMCRGGKN